MEGGFIISINLTWTITAVIAAASIFSPVIVTLLNNHHDYKVKKLENNSKIQQEILSNFTKYVEYLHGFTHISEATYQYANLLYIYFDVNDELMDKLFNTKFPNHEEFRKAVMELIKDLSKQIKSK